MNSSLRWLIERLYCEAKYVQRKLLRASVVVVHGVELDVSSDAIDPTVRDVLYRERYEFNEIASLQRVCRAGDTVLELGGGIGFIATLMAKRFGVQKVISVEANPYLAAVLASNARRNGVDVTVFNGILYMAANVESVDTMPFYVRQEFWKSSMSPEPRNDIVEVISVAVSPLNAFLIQCAPDVIVVDIEGGERDFVRHAALPNTVRNLVIEMHPEVLPLEAVSEMINHLSASGFALDVLASQVPVFVFSRAG